MACILLVPNPRLLAIQPGETVALGSASGGAAESQRTFSFPAAAGTLIVSYRMYDIPDSLSVYAGGMSLASTVGRVQGSATLTVPVSGQTSALIIVNPGSGLAGTAWDYTVSFTVAPSIQPISGTAGNAGGRTRSLTPATPGAVGDPVFAGSGAHFLDWSVLRVRGAREIDFRLGYNSLFTNFGAPGRSWHHNYEHRIVPLAGQLIYEPHAAESHAYLESSPGVYLCGDVSSRGCRLVRASDATYTLTFADQSRLAFDSTGTLLREIDKHGRTVILDRSAGRITRLTEPTSGVYLALDYNAQGFLSRITDNSGRSVRLEHDAGLEGKLLRLSLPFTGSPTSPPSWTFTYTSLGQLASATDPDGVPLFAVAFDSEGRVSAQEDGRPDTQGTRFLYDETSFPGQLRATVIDRNNSTLRFSFDSEYRLVSESDANGVFTTYTYDPLTSQLSLSEGPLSFIQRFQYDANGNLTQFTAPDRSVTRFTYDSRNNPTAVTDPLGVTTSSTFDAANFLTSLSLPDASVLRNDVGGGNQVTASTSPAGRRLSYTYSQGRMTRAVDATGVGEDFRYDAVGRLTGLGDGLGRILTFGYDANDNLVSLTSPAGRTLSRVYNGRRRLVSETDNSGAIRRWSYDGNANLVSTTDPLGAVTRFEYDPEDRLVAVVDPLGARATRTLDRAGRATAITDPLGRTFRLTYDTLGRVVRTTDPANRTTGQFTYDLRGRPTSDTDALGNTWRYGWDALSRPVQVTDPLARVTRYVYDVRGRLTAATNGAAETMRQLYDADNRVVAVADGRGSITDIEYDAAGRRTALTTALGYTRRLSYGGAGQLVSLRLPSGATASLSHDADGRLTRIVDPEGQTDVGYDAAGRVTTLRTDLQTVITHTYDAAGRMVSARDASGATLGYEWDAGGRLTKLTYASGRAVTYAHDAAGQLTQVTDWAGRSTRYTWDTTARLVRVDRPNGTAQIRAYDAQGQLTSLQEVGPGAARIAEWAYTYDAAGQLTAESVVPASPSWLPRAVLAYPDPDNRVATFNGTSVSYDADGNLRSGPLPNGTTGSYVFNARNWLTAAGGLTYSYDARGLRATSVSAGVTTRYVHDPTAPTPRLLAATSGTTLTEYVWGLGLLHEESAGQVRYYHFDRRGNAVAVSDATGAIRGRAYYGDWGEDAGTTGEMPLRFRFNGELGVQTDPNGLVLMGARYYHPLLRAFISADPVQFQGGMNWYAYAYGNPIHFADPSGNLGLIGALIGGTVGGIVSGTAAYFNGGDWNAIRGAAAGGAVAGAMMGSGAGLIAACLQAGTITTTGALALGGWFGVTSGIVGNTVEQVVQGRGVSEISVREQLISGGVNGVAGLATGGLAVGSEAVRSSTAAAHSALQRDLVTRSTQFIEAGASQVAVDRVRSQIVQGMYQNARGGALMQSTIAAIDNGVSPIAAEIAEETTKVLIPGPAASPPAPLLLPMRPVPIRPGK